MKAKKFVKSESAVSENIGFVLVMFITIGASAILYTQGMPILDMAEKSAHLHEMEQSFLVLKTSFDEVAFNQAPSRTSEIKIKSGMMSQLNESWIEIAGVRYPLGSIEYKLKDRIIAYENSAVFVKYLESESTLTLAQPKISIGNISSLPVIRLNGLYSKSGEGVVRIVDKASEFISPVYTVNTTVLIKSEYYKEWGEYFNETHGLNVSYQDAGKITTIKFPTGSKIYCTISKVNVAIY